MHKSTPTSLYNYAPRGHAGAVNPSIGTSYDDATNAVAAILRNAVAAHAQTCRATYEGLLRSVIAAVQYQTPDGRTVDWKARLRLYDYERETDVEADSDPLLPAAESGATRLGSLPLVAAWVLELATAYHGVPCAGLDRAVMNTKLKGLRTQMSSRRDSAGVMRINYEVLTNGKPRYMIARVDVERAGEVDDGRRLPGQRNIS